MLLEFMGERIIKMGSYKRVVFIWIFVVKRSEFMIPNPFLSHFLFLFLFFII